MTDYIIFLVPAEHHTSMIIGLVSGALLTAFGGCIQYILQRLLKSKKIVDETRSIFLYINMLLCLEYSSLGNLKEILDILDTQDQNRKTLQKFPFTEVSFLITQEYIQKLLFYDGLLKNSKHAEMIQKITLAESSYRQSVYLINQYNSCLDDEKIAGEERLRETSLFSAASLQNVIKLTCEEAKKLNENARAVINEVFAQLFRKEIKLATVDSEAIKATEI